MAKVKSSSAPTLKSVAKGLSAFRAAHDKNVIVPAKIDAALAKMAKEDAEAWRYELEFSKLADVGPIDLAAFRGKYEDHIVEVTNGNRGKKRVWFASSDVAKIARG